MENKKRNIFGIFYFFILVEKIRMLFKQEKELCEVYEQNAKTGLQFVRSDLVFLIDIKDSGRPAEADENKLKTLCGSKSTICCSNVKEMIHFWNWNYNWQWKMNCWQQTETMQAVTEQKRWAIKALRKLLIFWYATTPRRKITAQNERNFFF